MINANRSLWVMLVFAALLLIIQEGSAEENTAQYKKLLIKVPPFSMNAGDKIVGVKVTITNGRVTVTTSPRGWNCQLTGIAGQKQTFYCFSPNSRDALTMSSRLPEISIFDMSSVSGSSLDVEATVEMEDGNGKPYSKQFQESDLSIK